MSAAALTLAATALVLLVGLVFAAVLLLAVRRRHQELKAARELPTARRQLRAALEHPSPAGTEFDAIASLPGDLQTILVRELAASLSGEQLRRLAALAHGGEATVTAADFHVAFWAVGCIGLAGVWHFRRLAPDAGAALKARPAAGKA